MINSRVKSLLRRSVKQVETALQQADREEALKALRAAIPLIDGAASKGVIHKNTAARKVSRLTRKVNASVR